MKLVIHAPFWTKILFAVGIILMIVGLSCHFFGFPEINPIYMPFFLIGGVSLIIPYQAYFINDFLKYRPKT